MGGDLEWPVIRAVRGSLRLRHHLSTEHRRQASPETALFAPAPLRSWSGTGCLILAVEGLRSVSLGVLGELLPKALRRRSPPAGR
jgi:hypothetical protein